MATNHQIVGERGEREVVKRAPCPRCHKSRQYRKLPPNFECADVICKFCGFLAQVKAVRIKKGEKELPPRILSAAWEPQQQRITAGIFHGLYLVGLNHTGKRLIRIEYVAPHIIAATPEIWEPRAPLRKTAKRAGWQGYNLNVSALPPALRIPIFAA